MRGFSSYPRESARRFLYPVNESCVPVQGSTNRRALGLVNFVPALAYHICLNLPAAFTQPGARLLVDPGKNKFAYCFRDFG